MGDEKERQRKRQLEMLRLRREQRRLRDEDKFDTAAMVLGLSEENDKRFVNGCPFKILFFHLYRNKV